MFIVMGFSAPTSLALLNAREINSSDKINYELSVSLCPIHTTAYRYFEVSVCAKVPNRVPGETMRREVELDPQVSPEEIMSREVELGCQTELDFLVSLRVVQQQCNGHCQSL